MAYFHCTGGVDVSEDTVTASTLLSGYTAHDKNGNAISGGMTNRGAVAPAKLNCGGSYTIPAGYHNGTGKVEVNTLASHLSGDTVAAAYLLSGYKAHTSAGTAITGSMANRGATNAGLAINGTYTIPAGYHNGAGKVTQSISTKAATTHYAATTSKALVAAGYYCSGAQNLGAVTATNLSAGNIKSGVTISVSNGSANLYSVAGSYRPAVTLTPTFLNSIWPAVLGAGKSVTFTGTVGGIMVLSTYRQNYTAIGVTGATRVQDCAFTTNVCSWVYKITSSSITVKNNGSSEQGYLFVQVTGSV